MYRSARQSFLASLGCHQSNRDSLAEFAERITHAILGGALATSRVQKGHDLVTSDGQKVQVRYVANPYLANPGDPWVNEHVVDFRGDIDLYALLIVEALDAKTLLIFSRPLLASVASALRKRHPNQDTTIQLTRRNYQQLLAEEERFRALGVQFNRF
jgi:hypothetical protein